MMIANLSMERDDFIPRVKIDCFFCIIQRGDWGVSKTNLRAYVYRLHPILNPNTIPLMGTIICIYRLRKNGPRNGFFRVNEVWYSFRRGLVSEISKEPSERWETPKAFYYIALKDVNFDYLKTMCNKLESFFKTGALASHKTINEALCS